MTTEGTFTNAAWKGYSKCIAAAGAALGVIAASLADGAVSGEEAGAIVSAVVGVYAVYKVRNAA